MRRFNNRIFASALFASTALGLAMPAMAQETAGEDDDDVIVVTAQKREQNLQDVPLAITAIGTERLDELQVNEFADVVKFLPSVTIQQGGPGFAQVYFFLFVVLPTMLGKGEKAPQKPWEAAEGLEWEVPSPAPFHTFETPPKLDVTATKVIG